MHVMRSTSQVIARVPTGLAGDFSKAAAVRGMTRSQALRAAMAAFIEAVAAREPSGGESGHG